jgi:hypothetical protein
MEYVFTLKYQIANEDPDELVERLGAAGCDDALVGTGQAGRLALEFTRNARNAHAAMLSALREVRNALPDAKLIEATPDLVGLTDVADMVGVSRQNMRKLMVGHGTRFPPPVHEGSSALWHLADVLGWLKDKGNYEVDESLIEIAISTRQINIAKEVRLLPPKLQSEIESLLN